MMERRTIAFITVHIGTNVGSNLQAIATSEVLKQAGYEPVLIDYIPPRATYERYWKDAIGSLVRFVWRIISFPGFHYQKKLFRNYLAKYTVQTRPIYSNDDFSTMLPKADIYLTGSDQVWNFKWNEGYDYHYFFTGITGKKVAYASSIGMDSLTKEEVEVIKRELASYSKISVREDQAVKLLSTIGIESIQVIDPTLMLNREQWRTYIERRIVKEHYVLVYTPYNVKDKNQIYNSARRIAALKKLIVVAFSWDYFKERLADKTVFFASPGDFLSLMYYADYVITNSFHGTAFSINLNKEFWVFSPSLFSSRIDSLIKLLGLEQRKIEEELPDDAINDMIDYSRINLALDKERKRAMDYLISL